MSAVTRDAQAAKQRAQERVENARRIADAVDAYHQAADQIEAAQRSIAEASLARVSALRAMRDAGLSISEISDLTDLSASRVQALVRGEREHSGDVETAAEERGDPHEPAASPPPPGEHHPEPAF